MNSGFKDGFFGMIYSIGDLVLYQWGEYIKLNEAAYKATPCRIFHLYSNFNYLVFFNVRAIVIKSLGIKLRSLASVQYIYTRYRTLYNIIRFYGVYIYR